MSPTSTVLAPPAPETSAPERPARETKAQRAERIKRAKNPWHMMPTLLEYARKGFESIDPDDLNVRFRWWGLYTQGDGEGVYGGAVPKFMVRIRIPGGRLQSHQLRAIAGLVERYTPGFADLTNRQNIQLHGATIEEIPDVLFTLQKVRLSTLAACGDVTRNITGCPLAGVDADELVDASPLVDQCTTMLAGNDDFYNLPRKYKISITGCAHWCSYPEINDVGLTAIERGHGRAREVGFALRVGGGLSTTPHLAVPLPVFVPWHQAAVVVRGVSEIFRDSEVLRQDRTKARLKFLFMRHGWTAERFRDELEARIGYRLDDHEPPAGPLIEGYRDHVGIHPQRQKGLYYAGLPVLSGRITLAQMQAAAELAERFGDGSLRNTSMQNLVILNIPQARIAEFERAVSESPLQLEASSFWRGTVACTGSEFCKLALTETKGFGARLVEELERRMPGFGHQLKINIAGCPNACGQHWIADIGLQGMKMKVDGRQEDFYDVLLGGGLGRNAAFVRRLASRFPATQVPEAIERVLRAYVAERDEGESFRDFCRRHDDAALVGMLGARASQGFSS